jgi:hypothetical protein
MNTGELTLVFDETVHVDDLVVGAITLSDPVSSQSVTLTSAGSATEASSSASEDGTTVIIDLGTTNLDDIKSKTQLAVATADSVKLTATATAIKDMNGRSLEPVSNKDCNVFNKDEVRPTLESWELNMDERKITLTFSETMKALSLDATEFVLQNAAQSAGDDTLRAIASGVESTSDGTELSFVFSEVDADMIKIRTNLCTTADATGTDCYIRLTEDAAKDMDNNLVEPAVVALLDGKLAEDETPPELVDFAFEMRTGKPPVTLSLTFSETVLASSLNVAFISIINGLGDEVPLTQAISTQELTTPRIVEITLHADDLASVRLAGGLGSTAALTKLTIGSDAITDHGGNNVDARDANNALDVSKHTVDVTPPTVDRFDLDMDSGILTIYYKDDSAVSNVDPGQITIVKGRANGVP